MPLNPSDYTKDFEYAHLRLERYGWLLRKFELVAEDQMDPDIFELLALPRTGTFTDEEIAEAHRVASKKRMRAEKADGEAAREVGKAIDRARDILKSPEATVAYREWRAANTAARVTTATVPVPPQQTSTGRQIPVTPPVTPPQPVRRNPITPVLASVAVIAFGSVAFLALRSHTPGVAEAAGTNVTPTVTAAPTIAPVATPSAAPTVPPEKIESRKETEAASEINNTLAAELVTAQQKQKQGTLSAADAKALQSHMRQQAAESLRHADAALKLDPSNESAAYEAINALYYADNFAEANRRVQEALIRFPGNSNLKTIKTMIQVHLH